MRPWLLASFLAAFLAAPAFAGTDVAEAAAQRTVHEAMALAVDIPRQAEALVDLAWLRPAPSDLVRALARKELGDFGQNALPALLDAMARVRKEQSAEVLRTIFEARAKVTTGVPPEFQPALQEALWSGSAEARRLAIPELARYRDRFSVLLMIDAAEEDPSLLPVVIPALGEIGDDRARFYLTEGLNSGKPGVVEQSAVALARIGGRAVEPLRAALRSSSQPLRLTAARAILPVASENDLTAIYEYLAAHPTDDAPTVAALKAACESIEAAAEARRAAEAASAPKDF